MFCFSLKFLFTSYFLFQCEDNPYRRTLIFIHKVHFHPKHCCGFGSIIHQFQETYPGQDLFIKGGQLNGDPINIKINALENQWGKYNTWSLGDNQLDWNGYQDGQVRFILVFKKFKIESFHIFRNCSIIGHHWELLQLGQVIIQKMTFTIH